MASWIACPLLGCVVEGGRNIRRGWNLDGLFVINIVLVVSIIAFQVIFAFLKLGGNIRCIGNSENLPSGSTEDCVSHRLNSEAYKDLFDTEDE